MEIIRLSDYVLPPDSAQNCAGDDGGLVITADVPILNRGATPG
jgi:hypothetical protein